MFRIICPLLLACFSLTLSAQSYIGFGADNFNGVHGVLTNPANIADSRTLVDINLVSLSALTTNNYRETNYWQYFRDEDASFNELSTIRDLKSDVYGFSNVDILGPSVLVTLSPIHSIALTTRFRSLANLNNVSSEAINYFDNEVSDPTSEIVLIDQNSSLVLNNWFEVGASYARVIKNDRKHFVKAGASLKYLLGAGGGNAFIEDADLIYFDQPTNNDAFLDGRGEYNYPRNFDGDGDFNPLSSGDDFEFDVSARGLGLDLGVVYEYRPNHRGNISRSNPKDQIVIRHVSTYKFKIGVSVLDLGAINYQTNKKTFTFQTIDRNILENGDEPTIEAAFDAVNSTDETRLFLPARLRTEFDYKIAPRFYANATANISLVSQKSSIANRHAHQFTLSPRYESKWLTVFSPISVTSYGGVQWGGGFRLGPVFMGSGSLFSRMLDNETRSFDFFAGIKIPIFHKTPPHSHEEDPVSSYESNCNGCLGKPTKITKKRLNGFNKKAKKPKRVKLPGSKV